MMVTMLARTALRRAGGGTSGHSNLTFRNALEASEGGPHGGGEFQFDAQAIGTAAADRWVIVAAAVQTSAAIGCTIGGIAATSLVSGLSVNNVGFAIFAANVPTGTTATIQFTVAGYEGNSYWMAYWTVNMANGTVFDTSSTAIGGPTTAVTGVSIPALGFAVGMCMEFDAGIDRAMSVDSGFVERVEDFTAFSANFQAVDLEPAGSFSGTVTFTITGASANGCSAAIASWA